MAVGTSFFGFGALGGLAACDDDDPGRVSPGTFDGSPTEPDAAAGCGSCRVNTCNAAGAMCFDNPECRSLALENRSLSCENNAYVVFKNCLAEACKDRCPASAGISCFEPRPPVDAGADADPDAAAVDSGFVSTRPKERACQGCADGKCLDQRRACGPETTCNAFFVCLFECRDEACATRCENEHRTGATAAKELATCATIGCAGDCGF